MILLNFVSAVFLIYWGGGYFRNKHCVVWTVAIKKRTSVGIFNVLALAVQSQIQFRWIMCICFWVSMLGLSTKSFSRNTWLINNLANFSFIVRRLQAQNFWKPKTLVAKVSDWDRDWVDAPARLSQFGWSADNLLTLNLSANECDPN